LLPSPEELEIVIRFIEAVCPTALGYAWALAFNPGSVSCGHIIRVPSLSSVSLGWGDVTVYTSGAVLLLAIFGPYFPSDVLTAESPR